VCVCVRVCACACVRVCVCVQGRERGGGCEGLTKPQWRGAKQRWCAPTFRTGAALPTAASATLALTSGARKTDGLCIHDQFSGSPGVTGIQGEGHFVSRSIIKLLSLVGEIRNAF